MQHRYTDFRDSREDHQRSFQRKSLEPPYCINTELLSLFSYVSGVTFSQANGGLRGLFTIMRLVRDSDIQKIRGSYAPSDSSLSRNPVCTQEQTGSRTYMSEKTAKRNGDNRSLHFHVASFFRFMATNLSFTQFVT